ncbi:MAG TPA: FUSC family protein [Steroidobacteraceae bacterium]|jgi:uncharacterized membrane protein YgaE (UPF0421/DUF939 family)
MSASEPIGLRERLRIGFKLGLMTGLAAWCAYAASSLVGLKEGYWAAISAIVVLQQDLTSTRGSGRDRFIGTAIGGCAGWLCALVWHQAVWVYVLAVALTVFVCWLANISGAARLAAVAVTVIVLIPRGEALWKVALFRFLEVSWGIAVAIVIQLLVDFLERRRSSA